MNAQHVGIKTELELGDTRGLLQVLRSGEVPAGVADMLADLIEADEGLRFELVRAKGRGSSRELRWLEIGGYRQGLIDGGIKKTKATSLTAEHYDISIEIVKRYNKIYLNAKSDHEDMVAEILQEEREKGNL